MIHHRYSKSIMRNAKEVYKSSVGGDELKAKQFRISI